MQSILVGIFRIGLLRLSTGTEETTSLTAAYSDDRWQKVLGIQFKISSVVYFRT